jgi:hypothetical protein
MEQMRTVLGPGALAAFIAAVVAVTGAADERRVADALASDFGLSGTQMRDLSRRSVVVRTLETGDSREVAVLGAIHVAVPASYYVEQLEDIAGFKRHEAVHQIGVFSTPARVEDMASLTLERRHLDDLRKCRVTSCGVQLPRDAIERFQRDVSWSAPSATEQANQIMREILVDMVNAYRRDGDAALMVYEDKDRPLSVAQEFGAMVGTSASMLPRFPPLQQHLAGFPQPTAHTVRDVIYWSKERMGPAVIISVTHLAIATMPAGDAVRFATASKQLYGSQYFDSSLGLTILLEGASASDAPASVLVYVNRSRVDVLSGFFGGLKRTVVRSRARSGMSDTLVQVRDMIERRFATRVSR